MEISRTAAMLVPLAIGALPAAASAQSFTMVGLPPGGTDTAAYGVSADGSVVAGFSGTSAGLGPGWTWTASGGLNAFGLTEPGVPPNTSAFGISGDGRTIVGEAGDIRRVSTVAYRYRGPGTYESLGTLPGWPRARANDASYDGSVIVGTSDLNDTWADSMAFRWTPDTGMQALGRTQPWHDSSRAFAVSADGNTIVGDSSGPGSTQAFIWTPQTGMQALPWLDPAADEAHAYGMSSDGRRVVGESAMFGAQYLLSMGVMWTDGVLQTLGPLAPGYNQSAAYGVSDDGSIIIGQMRGAGLRDTAGIWTEQTGWRTLTSYLTDMGVTVPANINLRIATGISADGQTIVGYMGPPGTVRQGFVVTIPAPASVLIAPLLLGGLTVRRRR